MRRLLFSLSIIIANSSCGGSSRSGPPTVPTSALQVPFEVVAGHLIVVPVRINGAFEKRFILDTGIGINLISSDLCTEVGCRLSGSYSGRRMSGQTITVSLSHLGSLDLAGQRQKNVPVGVLDMKNLVPSSLHVDGFLSLKFFEQSPVTIDYGKGVVVLESPTTLRKIVTSGTSVGVEIQTDESSLSVFMPLSVAGRELSVEVDTGSNSLILHERYMDVLAVKEGPGVRLVEGKDETGNRFTRIFAQIPGPIYPPGTQGLEQRDLKVMFQKIIYDGLVGKSFLSRFRVTYDLPNSRMIFRQLSLP